MKSFQKYLGLIVVSLASISFGVMSIVSKFAYFEGMTGSSLSFYRFLFAMPVLGIIIYFKKIDLKLDVQEGFDLFILAIFGAMLTSLLLFESFYYIPAGIATTLHFAHPCVVILLYAIFKPKYIKKYHILSLVLCMLGILCFADEIGQGEGLGYFLAILSAFTYAFYIYFIDNRNLRFMDTYKLTFYICVFSVPFMLAYCLYFDTLVYETSAQGWLYTFIISMLAMVVATTLFQYGIRLIGGADAAICCTLEPLVSVYLGILILGDNFSFLAILGCVLILVSVLVVTIKGKR